MTTFGLYGARLSLAVWRHFTCYIFFVFTYYFVLSLKNKYTILYYTIFVSTKVMLSSKFHLGASSATTARALTSLSGTVSFEQDTDKSCRACP